MTYVRPLSHRQQRILDFVRRFWSERNYPPTVRDIAAGCGVSSTSVVDYNLAVLEQCGHIRRHPGISRGIELVNQARKTENPQTTRKVPIIGIIAAGEPIPVPAADAWDNISSSETIEVSADITRARQGVYALRVRGSSMIDSLINDGDIVLMEQVSVVENGETAAVWLKNEKEVTLKKVYRENERVRLQPSNHEMKPIYTAADNVEIQGKVIAVIRQL
jgi:repressor LexA